ncbi:hypothetical protein [Geodermatophilus obscurus]|uniref:LPXTG-motif cell wall anchor domain protein n=1 Tax=Geodermatophilus obscurus (strain ATCC 25078 / DSM 43160 / JCM 3152 / CCUG 61914 / KCC A-0152 / KCTC 9177 / NBRC 13315 / NRRL B-3577 / G-20) TaxID=526225 RepID=D2SDX8_GEOOG|nr:hypothetical protein [Geodermatophilus obscurus]ADB76544.1 LPXTG-motif cell wall anchor domain protein [Geodermatophilus obscurus DSM 43160]
MSRTTARAAAVTGLTATTAAAGLLLAPAAFAAAPSAPVVAPGTVAAEQTFTVSGADCVSENYADETTRNVVAVAVGDAEAEEPLFADVTEPGEDGKWSIELAFEPGDPAGEYVVAAACLLYNGGLVSEYPLGSVVLTAPAATPSTPTETAAPTTSAPETKPTGAIRGSQANTSGVTSPDGGSATGDSTPLGRKVVKVLTGFKPHEVVTVTLHSTPQTLGTFTADANGTVTVQFTVPAGTPTGEHTLVYEGNMGTYFQESLTVTAAAATSNASSSNLAYTGADVALPLGLGVGALALGGGLVFAARRRSAEGSQA